MLRSRMWMDKTPQLYLWSPRPTGNQKMGVQIGEGLDQIFLNKQIALVI